MSLAPDQQSSIMVRTVWTRLVGALCSGVTLLVGGSVLGYPTLPLGFLLVASIAESFFIALVRAHEVRQSMGTVTVFIILERVSYAIWVLGAVVLVPSIEAIAAATMLSIFSMLVVAALHFRRRFGWEPSLFDRRIVLAGVKQGWPFLMVSLLSTVYYRLDIVLLERLGSTSEAGVYNASMRVVEALMFMPMSAMATIFPVLSASFSRDPQTFWATLRRAGGVLGLVGALIALIITIGAGPLIDLLYPDRFGRSADVLRILGPMILFYFLNYLGSQALIAMHRERLLTLIVGGVAVLATIINSLLVPRYGALSSAGVRLLMELGMTVTFVSSIWRWRGVRPDHGQNL